MLLDREIHWMYNKSGCSRDVEDINRTGGECDAGLCGAEAGGGD